MLKNKCRECGKVCYGWAKGPFARCPYCGSAELEEVTDEGPASAATPEAASVPAQSGEEVEM